MTFLRRLLPALPLLVLSLLALPPLLPSAPAAAQPPEAGGPIGNERLLFSMPPGWRLASRDQRGPISVANYLPPGQDSADWQEMMVVQVFTGLKEKMPEVFLERVMKLSAETCEDTGAGPLAQQVVNGYPTALRVLACTKTPAGRGEVTAFLVVSGDESLYVIQRVWRGPPFIKGAGAPVPKETLGEWLGFMRAVSLCNAQNPKHPCPSAMQGQP